MKCIMCGAVMRPQIKGHIKYCAKCKAIIGKTKNFINYGTIPCTDKPKDKTGKYQPHLVLGSLTRAVARVREYGVRKYKGENGWKQQSPEDYMDAIGRHYDACRNDPASRDEESGLLHVAQLATDAMFVIQMLLDRGEDIDKMNIPPEVK